MGLEVIGLIISSLFLGYQGLAMTEVISVLPRVTITSLDESNFILSMLGMRVSLWGIIICILGLVISIVGVVDGKVNKDKGVSRKSYIPFIVLFIVLAILSLL